MSGNLLPFAPAAVVVDDKVILYLLNPNHPSNSGKANFFNLCGFRQRNWRALRDALRAHPAANTVVNVRQNPKGDVYEVRCNLQTPDGRNPCISSVWNLTLGTSIPHFVTAYP